MSTERDLYECQAREESEYLGFYPFNKEDNDIYAPDSRMYVDGAWGPKMSHNPN